MSAIKLREGLWSVGVLNPALRVFDIVMEAKYGTSYNAYLLTGEKNVLIETVHADYFEEYEENIRPDPPAGGRGLPDYEPQRARPFGQRGPACWTSAPSWRCAAPRRGKSTWRTSPTAPSPSGW